MNYLIVICIIYIIYNNLSISFCLHSFVSKKNNYYYYTSQVCMYIITNFHILL